MKRLLLALIATLALCGIAILCWTQLTNKEEKPKYVAIFFDDGPTGHNSQLLLSIVREKNLRISLAYVVKNLEQRPEVGRAFIEAGCEILNHSYSHKHPGSLDDEALEREIVHSQRRIKELLGHASPWFRPPYMEYDPRMQTLLKAEGMMVFTPPRIVYSEDWRDENSSADILKAATSNVQDGDVILLHEWRTDSIEQLPSIIDSLRAQGFEFLTCSEMNAYTKSKNMRTDSQAASY